ncbi:hypothetical protein RB595_003723 [Gaeumannomyces hyphopodioides]
MPQYSPTQLFSSSPIDGPANILTLRADLHRVFEERHFCLVPKVGEKSGGDVGEADLGRDGATAEREPPQLVLHVFNSTPSGQLPSLWHNRAAHPIPATMAVECFARSAWTVLSPRVFGVFLYSTPVPRRLLLWSCGKGEWETEKASPEMCRQMWKSSRSRSPRKRSAPRSAGAAEELLVEESLDLYDSGYFGTDVFENDGCYSNELGPAKWQKEEPRGRLRKRRLSSEGEQGYKDSGRSLLRRKMLLSRTS